MAARTLLAVPIVSATPPLAEQVQAARAAGADIAELRVDCIAELAAVEALLRQSRILPLILTIRAKNEGGDWTGDEAERIALLKRLNLLLPEYVDVEYATWQHHADELAIDPARLILSHHDLAGTPTYLNAVFERLAATPAAVLKAVFTAHDATDGCRVFSQLKRFAPQRPTIALAMGDGGICTRILAGKFRAFLTFAALDATQQSAAGQPTIHELRNTFRWGRIGPQTRVYGVIGWPVTHSLSPQVHNAAMTAADIDGVYVPLPIKPTWPAFCEFMACATRGADLGFAGFSVTQPHKENAFRWISAGGGAAAATAQRCAAVNTLVREPDGRWTGHNTDGHGALAALQSLPECPGDGFHNRRVSILGAGGVARALVVTLCDAGADVTIYNRSEHRARLLADQYGCSCQPWADRMNYLGDVLINCTSLGQQPAVDETPLPASALRAKTVVLDTVYRPSETQLVRAARARGCLVVPGLEMFLYQAAAQFRLWHNIPAPLDAMRAATQPSL